MRRRNWKRSPAELRFPGASRRYPVGQRVKHAARPWMGSIIAHDNPVVVVRWDDSEYPTGEQPVHLERLRERV